MTASRADRLKGLVHDANDSCRELLAPINLCGLDAFSR